MTNKLLANKQRALHVDDDEFFGVLRVARTGDSVTRVVLYADIDSCCHTNNPNPTAYTFHHADKRHLSDAKAMEEVEPSMSINQLL